MEKFNILTGNMAYIPLANIDTDMIIPKQYLKTIKRSGLGQYLFADLRYDINGKGINNFVLNKQPDTKILITGENFGCGSSREHAPWALLDFGIRSIIAPSFADIFYNNCFKNGILPIKLQQKDIEKLVEQSGQITVDLANQSIKYGSLHFFFAIDEHRKEVLLQGLDDIEKVLKLEKEISGFEQKHFKQYPWLEGAHYA
jgi:3-isopropylmalate/(R)-2-methylmalate dehydratase small subunit